MTHMHVCRNCDEEFVCNFTGCGLEKLCGACQELMRTPTARSVLHTFSGGEARVSVVVELPGLRWTVPVKTMQMEMGLEEKDGLFAPKQKITCEFGPAFIAESVVTYPLPRKKRHKKRKKGKKR